MSRQDHTPTTELTPAHPNDGQAETAKKPFVEPAVSVPQDVLEATALFQGGSSGVGGGGGADGVDGVDI